MSKYALIITATLALFIRCGSSPTAGGGTSDQGNARVAAIIETEDGTPASGAFVRLRRSDYRSQLPALGKTAIYGADALTDSNGRFEISGIDPGSYRIEVNNGKSATLFACSLDLHDTVNLGADTLRPFATLIGAVDTTGTANPQLFVQVAGLERLAAVGIDGRYSLADVPQGTFSLHVGSNASGAATTIIAGVQAVAADTAVVRSPLPAPWTGASIGNETPVGGAMYTNGRFTITGGGPDIWNTADGFHFVYQPWSGDGEIVAHITSFEYGHYSCKAGLMFRETLDPSSVNIGASLEIDPMGRFSFYLHNRKVTADTCNTTCQQYPIIAPQWVRLTRTGNLFSASVSQDGIAWGPECADTIVMSQDVYVGLTVTSHETTRLLTALFQDVSVR
jgi:regulation of enolase protein 1 (concanavalin A-like superfamily)